MWASNGGGKSQSEEMGCLRSGKEQTHAPRTPAARRSERATDQGIIPARPRARLIKRPCAAFSHKQYTRSHTRQQLEQRHSIRWTGGKRATDWLDLRLSCCYCWCNQCECQWERAVSRDTKKSGERAPLDTTEIFAFDARCFKADHWIEILFEVQIAISGVFNYAARGKCATVFVFYLEDINEWGWIDLHWKCWNGIF